MITFGQFFARGFLAISICATTPVRAAIYATIPSEYLVVPQNHTSNPDAVLIFSGSNAPQLEIYGSSFGHFLQKDPDTSLLTRSVAQPVDYPQFHGFAAALAAGAVIGSSSWLVNEPHVDTWGEARWGKYDDEPGEDYFVRSDDSVSLGELYLQNNPAYQNPGQQGGRKYVGVGWRRGDDYYFGWVKFAAASGLEMYIESWAWESEANKPIVAGAIPEPSVLYLGASACVTTLWRRRRGRR
jgi:hypothetical protein